MNEFKERYRVDSDALEENESSDLKIDPNKIAHEIAKEQLSDFADFVRGTPNEDLIAYKDPKVQELVDYIMAAIIIENGRMNNPDNFPIQIYRRYKSDKSLKDKMEKINDNPDFKGLPVPDFLGFKIIPEAQHSIFASNGDLILQAMINKREETRSFIASKYAQLAGIQEMTFEEYYKHTQEVIDKLVASFPYEAIERKFHYDELADELRSDIAIYEEMHENADNKMTLDEIFSITNVNINKLLAELTRTYPNEVVLYKLKKDLMNVFEHSEVLKNLGVSISVSPSRTKRKSKPNGYRAEFIGLNLMLDTNDRSNSIAN